MALHHSTSAREIAVRRPSEATRGEIVISVISMLAVSAAIYLLALSAMRVSP